MKKIAVALAILFTFMIAGESHAGDRHWKGSHWDGKHSNHKHWKHNHRNRHWRDRDTHIGFYFDFPRRPYYHNNYYDHRGRDVIIINRNPRPVYNQVIIDPMGGPIYTQPSITYSSPPVGNVINSATDGRYCREYQNNVRVGGRTQGGYGQACLQPDGDWEIVE